MRDKSKAKRKNLQVKGANMEETGVRGREGREKVRRDEKGQAFTGGEEKRRSLDGGWAAAQVEHTCPCSSVAPCLHGELHALLLTELERDLGRLRGGERGARTGLYWAHSSSGEFTVASAYDNLSNLSLGMDVTNKTTSTEGRLIIIQSWSLDLHLANLSSNQEGYCFPRRKEEISVGWSPPITGGIALNVDGAFKKSQRKAAAAGVLRDEHGNWLCGFSMKLEKCSAFRAELWGIFKGLSLAWELGYRNIDLQIDNRVAVQSISLASPHPC
ncbi:Uncharacterized protein TCM_038187 [Theobroma cacao]|uniref:RNase H type-1 domain-containing protein n=1 Tax=Theobroma cacao TaxID=3641 RepID=A0A061GPB0_THECC|nr:Uncharacterized protein TCM_038187 [Theobroma cacao]